MTGLGGFKALLASGIGRAATAVAAGLGVPVGGTRKQFRFDPKRGPKGVPFCNYGRYERKGPLYRQIGLLSDGRPKMEAYFVHRFLHSTKGWRVFDHIPLALRVAAGSPPPAPRSKYAARIQRRLAKLKRHAQPVTA